MDDPLLPGVDRARHDEPGYRALLHTDGDWIAALMNGTPESWAPPPRFEKHPYTDELFVLLRGRARMVVAGDGSAPGTVVQADLEPGILYLVRRGVWHATPMSEDAAFVIIERDPAGIEGFTERVPLSDEQRRAVRI